MCSNMRKHEYDMKFETQRQMILDIKVFFKPENINAENSSSAPRDGL